MLNRLLNKLFLKCELCKLCNTMYNILCGTSTTNTKLFFLLKVIAFILNEKYVAGFEQRNLNKIHSEKNPKTILLCIYHIMYKI